jgi:hypothetical protein
MVLKETVAQNVRPLGFFRNRILKQFRVGIRGQMGSTEKNTQRSKVPCYFLFQNGQPRNVPFFYSNSIHLVYCTVRGVRLEVYRDTKNY